MLDVVLMCEGTYPYVPGGVSSWIHALITGMPELTFGIVYIAPTRDLTREFKFPVPENVIDLVEIYIYDTVEWPQKVARGPKDGAWKSVASFLGGVTEGKSQDFLGFLQHVRGTDDHPATLAFQDLVYSKKCWDIAVDLYRRKMGNSSFLDFFWNWRFAHIPLFQLMYAEIPQGRVYHTITTGWSGMLGAIAKVAHQRPLILTEHGIYTNERRIEIAQADWIFVDRAKGASHSRQNAFKEMWMNVFLALGDICYQHVDEIFTLYEGNRKLQIRYGADPRKIGIIPNGVRISLFETVDKLALPRRPDRFVIGFVGRVVPIKDVKTLIKACRTVFDAVPEAEAYLLGPTEEDPDYFEECKALVEALGLGDRLTFKGKVNVREWYPCLDVQVLTSISEGQPLVILEGFCSGVPVVATNVGACSEIIHGMDEADQAMGPAGIVTRVGNPSDTAEALIRLARDPELRRRMAEAGKKRVRIYYDHDDMIRRYREIYGRYQKVASIRQAMDTLLGSRSTVTMPRAEIKDALDGKTDGAAATTSGKTTAPPSSDPTAGRAARGSPGHVTTRVPRSEAQDLLAGKSTRPAPPPAAPPSKPGTQDPGSLRGPSPPPGKSTIVMPLSELREQMARNRNQASQDAAPPGAAGRDDHPHGRNRV